METPRHAILSILGGPLSGRKIVLAPGDVIRVGRSEEADVSLPHDGALGKVHFEIDWDGERAELRSRRGGPRTELQGEPVIQAWVCSGSFIHAGSTDFTVHYEAHTPPRVPPPEPRPSAALAALSAERNLYGVFDAARDDRVIVLLRESIDPHQSLYEGLSALSLAEVAPYLVQFVPGSRLLAALVEEGWGQAWGIYIASGSPQKALRRHLRQFLMVEEDETGKRFYFRFYDPRVLRDFLSVATVRQKSELFGEDVERFILEGPLGEVIDVPRP